MAKSRLKTPLSSWNFLRDNTQLRSIISYKIDSFNVKWVTLGKELGVADHLVKRYIDNKPPSLTNFQIIKLANYLDIDVSLNIDLRAPLSTP